MSTHNIGFYEDLTKIVFELSSNTQLISSAGKMPNIMERFYRIITQLISIFVFAK